MKLWWDTNKTTIGAMARTIFLGFGVAFFGIVITMPSVLDAQGGEWKVALAAGLTAAAKLIYNYFDDGYKRYGIGS